MNSKALFKIPLIYGNYGLCIKHSIFSSSKNIHKKALILSRSWMCVCVCVSLSEQENSISLMLTGNLRFFIFRICMLTFLSCLCGQFMNFSTLFYLARYQLFNRLLALNLNILQNLVWNWLKSGHVIIKSSHRAWFCLCGI